MKRLILGLAAAATLAGALPAMAQSVDSRDIHQQQRIDQGVRSGELTPGETQRLEHRELRTDVREARMRAHDHGRLTHHDRRVLHRMQSRNSHAIYRLKHNGRVD